MKFLLALLLSFFSVSMCRAAMGWDEIFQTAMQSNPSLRTAENSLKSAEYALKSSYSPFMPRISASASRSLTRDRTSAGISASMPLFAGGANVSSLGKSRVSYQREQENYRRTLSNTVYSLKIAYAGVLRAREEVLLSEEVYNRREDNYHIVELRYEAGREDRGAYLRAEADLARARMDLSSAHRELDLSILGLLKEMGLKGGKSIDIEGALDVDGLPFDPDVEKLVKKTPEYITRSLNIESVLYDRRISRSNFLPGISLSASRSYDLDGFDFTPAGDWSAGISMSIPLFTGFRNTYNLKSSNVALITAEEQKRAAEMDIYYDIKAALSSLENAKERISVQEKYFRATRERAEIAREKYLNGLISYQDWNTIENDYIAALGSMLVVRHGLFAAAAAWKRVLGEH